VDERHGFVVVALVVVLVLDEAEVDEVAHGGTRVPAHVVGIDVDLLQVPDHFVLIGDIGLRTRCCRREARRIRLVAICARAIDCRKREGICDLKYSIVIHAHK
jgi:hypothetical protein